MGPEIRKLRKQRGWSQPVLVAKLNLFGWEISRETLAKIENQIRWVADIELVSIAAAFGLPPAEILPSDSRRRAKQLIQN